MLKYNTGPYRWVYEGDSFFRQIFKNISKNNLK
jgi:hypothetical protein